MERALNICNSVFVHSAMGKKLRKTPTKMPLESITSMFQQMPRREREVGNVKKIKCFFITIMITIFSQNEMRVTKNIYI